MEGHDSERAAAGGYSSTTGRRAWAANELTHLGAWIAEQLASHPADLRTVLEVAAGDIARIAVGLAGPRPEPERDPDLEDWLSRQLARTRGGPAGPDDMAAIGKLAARPDGTVSETVARWLRETRNG